MGKIDASADEIARLSSGLWSVNNTSAANAAVTTSKAAEPGKRHYVTGFSAVISGAAAANDISVELRDGATVKWREYIGSGAARGARVAVNLGTGGIEMSVNAAVNLVVSAGGAGVVTDANLVGFTAP
jgi:hypothetical protein